MLIKFCIKQLEALINKNKLYLLHSIFENKIPFDNQQKKQFVSQKIFIEFLPFVGPQTKWNKIIIWH